MPGETPTEVLIDAMEDIEQAKDLLIVWREEDENGVSRMNWRVSRCPMWRALGLIEAAKIEMVNQTRESD